MTNQMISVKRHIRNRIFRCKYCCEWCKQWALYYLKLGGIAQSVQRIARAGRFRVRTPGGWGESFFSLHLSRPVLGHTKPPIQSVLEIFPAGNAVETWHRTPTPPRGEVKHGQSYTSTLLSAPRLLSHQWCPSFSETQGPP